MDRARSDDRFCHAYMMLDVSKATTTQAADATAPDPAAIAGRLFPIRRSLTGPGVRETLAAISDHVPLSIHEVPTGTPVLDWVVPREWILRDAWVEDLSGRRVIDIADHPLHVLGYSAPVDEVVSREELIAHLHGLPEHPDWIPYRTSYYREAWGFCAQQRTIDHLVDRRYRVRIDADLVDGSLTYGEWVLPGTSDRGGPAHDPRLPSGHGQRQRVGDGGPDGGRRVAGHGASAAHLPRALPARERSDPSPGWPATPVRCRPSGTG